MNQTNSKNKGNNSDKSSDRISRSDMKKYVAAVITSIITILLFYGIHLLRSSSIQQLEHIKIGFIFDGDESTPYTANYIHSMEEAQAEFGDKVEMIVRYNVPYEATEEVIREFAQEGCAMVFTNSFGYGETAKKMAGEYPEIEFCEATCDNANTEPVYENYHTFMGEIYQGRYIAGKVAGMKMQEMIDQGIISEAEAWAGYVGAYPYAEVISGYTAFFLGIRSECPTARMRVKYTGAWTSYVLEKKCAEELIAEGCVIISQHSDTIGPASACEKADVAHPVYHVGYNQDMIDVAPTTSLISTRINWTPYMIAAIKAVLKQKKIEAVVKGNVHGNDVGAGFERDWVRMLELNDVIAAEGSEEMVGKTIQAFKKGKCKVFQGDYIGVNPDDDTDRIDLADGYSENKHGSAPSFYYILEDVIIVEE